MNEEKELDHFETEVLLVLSDSQKLKLINLFYEGYFNTAQDTKLFSEEFFYTVGSLLKGNVPVKLKHLAVDEMMCDILRIVNDSRGKLGGDYSGYKRT